MNKIVSIQKCENYEAESVKTALLTIFNDLGGIEKFVAKGTKVALKPNLLLPFKPHKAATTHPSIVKALTEILIEQGAEVSLVESPGGPYLKTSLKKVYKACGMESVSLETDLKLNYDLSTEKIKAQNPKVLNNIEVLKPLLNADVIINLPKLKSHGMMTYTGAVKNMFGSIPGIQKADYHFKLTDYNLFANGLIDIFLSVKPKLSIIDAVVGMDGEGPSAGTRKKLNFIAASEDAFALDYTCLHIIGAKPEKIPIISEAQKRNLAPYKLEDVVISGSNISDIKISKFDMPSAEQLKSITFFDNPKLSKLANLLKPKPIVNFSKCIGCKICAENCPAKIINMKNKKPYIKLNACIRCFCCQELCPQHAIKIKKLPKYIKLLLTAFLLLLAVTIFRSKKNKSISKNK